MTSVKISLNSIDKVKNFVNDITRFDSDFDLVSGRYVIDAKSIMGIFSLDIFFKQDTAHAVSCFYHVCSCDLISMTEFD